MDHCPTVTGGLYDEDGDGIGDDCDRCPIAKPPAVPDQDGDDVVCLCVLVLLFVVVKILLFDVFSGTTLDPRWTAVTPSAWSVEGGALVVRLATQDTQDFISTSVVPEPNLAVQSSYRVDKVEASSTTHIVSALAIDQRPAGVSSLECGVVKSDDGTAGEVVDLETDQSAVSHAAMIGAFDSARLYRNAMVMTGTTAECVVIGDNTSLAAVQSTITLTARAVTARFQWVLVVGRSNTGTGGT